MTRIACVPPHEIVELSANESDELFALGVARLRPILGRHLPLLEHGDDPLPSLEATSEVRLGGQLLKIYLGFGA